MCGLVGVAGRVTPEAKKAFKRLLELDTIRGPHSTGVMFVRSGMIATDSGAHVVKKMGTPWELFQTKPWDENYGKENRVLMGHNRWATTGAINALNAHPFEFKNIIGSHNGTLRNQALLDDHKQFDVDSENLYYHMDKHGLDDTLMKTHGAFALTWWDKRDNTINFIRNTERTLFYVKSESGETLFWASEDWMLRVALTGAGVKYGKNSVKMFCELNHYKLEVPACSNYVNNKLKEMECVKKEVYSPPVVKQSSHHGVTAQNSTSARLADYVGKTVEFCISSSSIYGSDSVTYFGYLVGNSLVKVRVWCKKDDDVYKIMSEFGAGVNFKAEISGYSVMAEGNLFVKGTTVERVFRKANTGYSDGGVGTKIYPGFDRDLDYKEWLVATSKCCAWCGDVADIRDAKKLLWLSHNEFICEGCKGLEEVTQYVYQ